MSTPSASLVCWKCGASLAGLSLPLARLDECRGCGAALHVCKLCEFYSVSVAKQCREPIAEEVKDKERANFCDYFKPRPNAWTEADPTAASRARSELEALFGASAPGGPSGEPPGEPSAHAPSAADRARAAREGVFKK